MKLIKNHLFLILIIFGFLIRLIFIFGSYAFDVNNHIVWAEDLHKFGFTNFFNKQSSEIFAVKYPNYPPLALFIFYLFYPLPKIIFNFFWFLNIKISFFPSSFLLLLEKIDKRLFIASMLKLPAIISDIGLAYILTLFIEKINNQKNLKNLKLFILALILFNPVFIYNSSIWGQIDSIPLLFLMIAFYFLLFTNKSILSSLFLTISLLIKPTIIIFLPIYLLIFIKKFRFLVIFKNLFFSHLLFFLAFYPFIGQIDLYLPYKIYWNKILLAQSLSYVTNSAFNFWMIITNYKKTTVDSSLFFLNLSYRFWGNLLAGAITLFILFKILKIKISKQGINYKKIFYYLFLNGMVFLLFLTKMHERYFLLPLPFLLLVIDDNKENLKYFLFFSFFAFLNHYQSWSFLSFNVVSNILNNPFFIKIISFINILVFLRFVKINSCKL